MKKCKILLLLLIIGFSTKAQDKNTSSYMQAGKAFKAGDYNKSLSIAKTVSKNDPLFENAQLLIGYCYLELDSLKQAENIFMDVLKTNNVSSQAFNGLGLIHYKKISDEKMIVKFLKNIFSSSEESQAEEMFFRALKYNERYPEARFNLARLYLRMKDEVKHISADNILAALVREYPEKAEFKLLQGKIKYKLGKFKEAQEILKSNIEKNPDNLESQFELALAEFRLGQYDKFSKHYLSALKSLTDTQILLKIFQDTYDILSNKEVEVIQNMGVDGSYYYNFWHKRDPNLVTDINERLVIHYQRLKYARDMYGADTFTGYDDRGMIYVRYGEPDQKYIGISININVKDNESWVYKIMDKTLAYDFVQKGATFSLISDLSEVLKSGIGTNVLSKLQRVYEERSHLDGPYMRIVNELSNIEVSRQHDSRIENITPYLTRHRIAKEKAQRGVPKSTFKYKLDGKDLPFSFNYAWFYEKDRIRLELYYGLNRSDITANLKTLDGPIPELNQYIKLVNDNYETILHNESKIDLNVNRFRNNMYITQINTWVNYNFVNLNIELECNETNQRRLINLPINIDEYSIDEMNVSSIQFSNLVRRNEATDDTTNVKKGLIVKPYPFTNISKSELIYLYFEIYNLILDNLGMGEYEINLKIYRDNDSMDLSDLLNAINPFSSEEKESVQTSFSKNTNKSFVPEYFALDLSALNVGRYRLVVGITDIQSNLTINRRVLFDLIE
jgi:GWxTD domain-containing protein